MSQNYRVGEYYTRTEISLEFGDKVQTYLPQKDDRIEAGCFTLSLNPKAPREIQVGNGPEVVEKAKLLTEQSMPIIPVFIKDEASKSSKCWQYFGKYRFDGLIDSLDDLKAAMKISGRKDVVYLLRLRPVR